MNRKHRPSRGKQACVLCAMGLALTLVPREVAQPARALLRDALRPGQGAIRLVCTTLAGQVATLLADRSCQHQHAELAGRVAVLQQQNRQLQIEAAAFRRRLREARLASGAWPEVPSSEPLVVPRLVSARWLGADPNAAWRRVFMVDAGASRQVSDAAWVLERAGPIVDAGLDAGVAAGDQVLAGRVVVGKIAEVGRYVSTVVCVTDPNFSGRARVYRRTSSGLAEGPEGILVGQGQGLCRMKHVTEPVNPGDEVFTGGDDPSEASPMYIGRVIRAQPAALGREWSILVQPAADRQQDEVLILRLTLNPQRVLAN